VGAQLLPRHVEELPNSQQCRGMGASTRSSTTERACGVVDLFHFSSASRKSRMSADDVFNAYVKKERMIQRQTPATQ